MKTMPTEPKLKLGTYQHYKGGVYKVVGLACHSETLEWLVIYESVERKKQKLPYVWARPYEMFVEKIEVDGKKIQRFKKIN